MHEDSINKVALGGLSIVLENDYKPNHDKEEYMSHKQLAYFKDKLTKWRMELENDANLTRHNLGTREWLEPDLADRAATEIALTTELRCNDRACKLIERIDSALKRIEDGTYGFCLHTENPIGIARLEARPIATLCIEAQEEHERFESLHNDSLPGSSRSNDEE